MTNKKYKQIKFYANRPNRGATGGPGGVLYLQKNIIGNNFDNINLKYNFAKNTRFWRKHKFLYAFFKIIFNELFDFNSYYIVNDIESAYILSFLHKSYSLVYHQQGPIVEEKNNFGKKLSNIEKSFLHFIEKYAFINAQSVHFPSKGAQEMYFSSLYRSCDNSQVFVGDVLPNTIENNVIDIKKDDNVLTFLSVGTLTNAKGQDQTILFLEELLKQYNNKIRYIMIGKGPNKDILIDKLNLLNKKYNNFNYIYKEQASHDEILRLNDISDIYIMLHRISIFDLATLEAMSNSCAVILSKIGGNVDFNVKNNIIFIENNDYKKAVLQLLNSDINSLKQLNKYVFNNYFSENCFGENYKKFISSVLNNNSKSLVTVERERERE